MRLISELRRRNVFRMAVLYVVAAWLIMQVAEVVIGLANLPDWIGPTILGLLALGFPIALVFSWFYELTPEGLRLEKDGAPGESITKVTGRRLDVIVISLLSAAVLLFAYDKWWPQGTMEQSIAVLPFQNMSGEPEQEYFSDGISEEILNALAHVPELHVISRSSAFSFKGKSVDIPTIAGQLGVAYVVEGSVRKSGARIRIAAQLIEASTDKHLWSETYDRDLVDVFAVQDDISAATEASIESAFREFEKAVDLDPDYALAHAEMAIAALLLYRYYFGDLSASEALATAIPHAERAYALDPTLAEANAATGFVLSMQDKLEEALHHYRQAVRINPNYAIAYNWIGTVLSDLGRYDEILVEVETALRLDPLSSPSRHNYVSMLINRNRLAEAELELEKLATIHPSLHSRARGELSSLGGKWANAVLAYLDALRITPESKRTRHDLGLLFAILGLEKEAFVIAERPQPRAMRMLGRPLDAVAAAEALLAEDPTDIYLRRDLGRALASAGDFARAGPILEETWQLSGKRNGALFEIDSAAALIAIGRDAGDEDGTSELLAAITDEVQRLREGGITARYELFGHVKYEDGLATYLSGEHEKGLALIARAVEDGFFIPPSEAYLQALYRDPDFPRIRGMQEAIQAREQRKFLAIVCGDNPYADFWQPASGTCEHFAAAVGN
jgi:TolB-like protein/Flp pilus assembly protein TadD